MKRRVQAICRIGWWAFAGILPLTQVGNSQPLKGLPEAGLLICGSISNMGSGSLISESSLRWMMTEGSCSIVLTSTWVVVNSQPFHITRVPFETRVVSGASFAATPNVFELKTVATSYTRTPQLGTNQISFVNESQQVFTFSATNRGSVERVDLRIAGDGHAETFEQWSLRILGRVASRTEDADRDGMDNYSEYLSGTDPTRKDSRLEFVNVLPNPSGGLLLQWSSVVGKKYTLEKSSSIPGGFTPLKAGVSATPPLNTFTDLDTPGMGPYFYQIKIE